MEMQMLEKELSGCDYPGRGIVIGKSEDGKKAVTAYFIMGRSENSRNRVFVEDGEGIRTQAFDPSKLSDPSLIIYAPVRVLGNDTIVTNGDQTDTVYDLMSQGKTFEESLRTREFEPDGPNYTPRISGIMHIENGNYTDAVQKLLAAIRLEPKIREMYLSLNTACSHTNQISILKQYLIKAKAIFEEDDEICYYLGNIYQNENNFQKAIAEYSLAIKYAQKNGEDFELVYAYYQNRASCYLKINECSKSIPDFTYALKLNPDNGAIYANRGIAYYKTGKKTEACKDWRKAQSLGIQSAGTYVRRYCR